MRPYRRRGWSGARPTLDIVREPLAVEQTGGEVLAHRRRRRRGRRARRGLRTRSEEHTSELQSLTNLVCRLLLEKKKRNYAWRRPGRPWRRQSLDYGRA